VHYAPVFIGRVEADRVGQVAGEGEGIHLGGTSAALSTPGMGHM
jgi:hypothetical protein